MLVKLKDIPFYYLNFEGYIDRKIKMENLISSLGINALRISNSDESNLRQNRIASGAIKLLSTAIEINKYPFVMMDDDIELIKDLPEFISIPNVPAIIWLGGSLYETGGYKPEIVLDHYDENYYRVYYMLSTHSIILSNYDAANFLLDSIKNSLNNNEFCDVDIAMKSKEFLYLTPKDGPYFYQDNYNKSVTRFLWKEVRSKYL